MSKTRNFTEEEKALALKIYHEEKSSARTRQILGYPSKECLRKWIMAENRLSEPKRPASRHKTKNASYNEKINSIHRCYDLGEALSLVAQELGRDPSTIRSWYRKYCKEGPTAIMGKPKKKKTSLKDIDSLKSEKELKAKVLELQLENDILRETIDI